MFDFSSRAPTIESCAEIEASEDDSVQSLANLATRDGMILYAGTYRLRLYKGQDLFWYRNKQQRR